LIPGTLNTDYISNDVGIAEQQKVGKQSGDNAIVPTLFPYFLLFCYPCIS